MTSTSAAALSPFEIIVPDEEARQWKEGFSFSIFLSAFFNRFMPRGRGAMPRLIGGLTKNHRRCISTNLGAKLAVHPGSMEVYASMVNNRGTWNPHVMEACRKCLNAGQVFYDIGANIGFISIEIARAFGGNITALAFEPQTELSRIIQLSAKLNGYDQVRVFDAMLGDHDGEADLFVGSHTIHASAVPREEGSRRLHKSVATLDTLISNGMLPPPDVIKIDIEGGELAAFKGASNLIKNHHPHIVFESDENMKRFGYAREDLLGLLSSLASYEFLLIDSESGEMVPIEAPKPGRIYVDILARSTVRHERQPVI